MASLGSALQAALHSLEANQYGLAIASKNISNAQTEGYTRQRARVQPSEHEGVEVLGTEALRDRLIELRLREETSNHAEDLLRHQVLSDIETFFNESESTGFLPQLTAFFNSFHALSAEPTSISRRQEVLSNALNLTTAIASRRESLGSLHTRTDQSIRSNVAQINVLADRIAEVTKQITEHEILSPAFELRDQRQVLLKQLSQIAEVHELESNGNYQVTIGSNRLLVYNGSSTPLKTFTDSNGFTGIRYGVDDMTAEVSGGELGARIDLRDSKIPGYIDTLDQIAYELVQQVNSVHFSAHDLDGNTGLNFFTPLTGPQGAAASIAVESSLMADPRRLAASQQVTGDGNEAAIQLGNLLHAPVFGGVSITERYSSFIYTLGSDTANAELLKNQHEALINQLENRRQEISGVSIDEETVKILQFQRAFEASARVVRAVDELLQLTLSLGA